MRRTMSEREKLQAQRLAHEVADDLQLAVPLCRQDLKLVRYKLKCERGETIRDGWEKQDYLCARSIVESADSTLYPQPWPERMLSHIASDLLIKCAPHTPTSR